MSQSLKLMLHLRLLGPCMLSESAYHYYEPSDTASNPGAAKLGADVTNISCSWPVLFSYVPGLLRYWRYNSYQKLTAVPFSWNIPFPFLGWGVYSHRIVLENTAWSHLPAFLLIGCVTLIKLVNLSVSQFPINWKHS